MNTPDANQKVIDDLCLDWLDTSLDTVSAPMRFRLKQMVGELRAEVEKWKTAAESFGKRVDAAEAQLHEVDTQRGKVIEMLAGFQTERDAALAQVSQAQENAARQALDLNKALGELGAANAQVSQLQNGRENLIQYWSEGFARRGFTLHPGLTPEQNVDEWTAQTNQLISQHTAAIEVFKTEAAKIPLGEGNASKGFSSTYNALMFAVQVLENDAKRPNHDPNEWRCAELVNGTRCMFAKDHSEPDHINSRGDKMGAVKAVSECPKCGGGGRHPYDHHQDCPVFGEKR